jgi:hypothetical protein
VGRNAVTAKLVDPAKHFAAAAGTPLKSALMDAISPPPNPASRAKGTDFVMNGVLLSPHKMQASSDLVTKGGTLLSGPARFWETSSLVYQFFHQSRVGATVTASPGTELQKAEVIVRGPLGLRETRIYWCGAFTYQAMGIRLPMAHCIRQDNVQLAELSQVAVRGTPLVYDPSRLITREVLPQKKLDLRAGPNLPPEDLKIDVVLVNSTKSYVDLVFKGGRTGVADPFFEMRLPWKEDGLAQLPFWTHTLLLRQQGNGVAVEWLENAPGIGPIQRKLELSDESTQAAK